MAQAAPVAAAQGQWVYTQQYGWVWMPYGSQYTYTPTQTGVYPSEYVYSPSYGWSWVVAPWVFGWGITPYYGVYGASHFGWYHHGYRPFYGGGYGYHPVYGGYGYRGYGSYGYRAGSYGYRAAPAYQGYRPAYAVPRVGVAAPVRTYGASPAFRGHPGGVYTNHPGGGFYGGHPVGGGFHGSGFHGGGFHGGGGGFHGGGGFRGGGGHGHR
jgi:hypothetical protein